MAQTSPDSSPGAWSSSLTSQEQLQDNEESCGSHKPVSLQGAHFQTRGLSAVALLTKLVFWVMQGVLLDTLTAVTNNHWLSGWSNTMHYPTVLEVGDLIQVLPGWNHSVSASVFLLEAPGENHFPHLLQLQKPPTVLGSPWPLASIFKASKDRLRSFSRAVTLTCSSGSLSTCRASCWHSALRSPG